MVTQKKNFASARQEREAFFWQALQIRPELVAGLRVARQVHSLREEGDYSYAMKQICGETFVLVAMPLVSWIRSFRRE
ncbi:hypothetical protein KSF_075070 [Reticulibacter mediterranei]|uniref:Uncharacterized protein n=1 Tax=Reticulibacter mediterranei TaxID=2778369 RepID=A0A8J3IT90_9CHLR|nr:hypothetical protein [Reticulibacter mediterranei]GHO97459.1 hypothetical protein KSF_075070 [Reticulibacter mediterranei]